MLVLRGSADMSSLVVQMTRELVSEIFSALPGIPPLVSPGARSCVPGDEARQTDRWDAWLWSSHACTRASTEPLCCCSVAHMSVVGFLKIARSGERVRRTLMSWTGTNDAARCFVVAVFCA